MSKPLTEEVAREYGYPEDSFEKWLGKYFDSLKVEERANQIQPIKQFKSKVGMPLLTEEIKKYVSEIKRGKYSTHLTLNPNYIYIIKFAIPYGQKKYHIIFLLKNHLILEIQIYIRILIRLKEYMIKGRKKEIIHTPMKALISHNMKSLEFLNFLPK